MPVTNRKINTRRATVLTNHAHPGWASEKIPPLLIINNNFIVKGHFADYY